MRIHRKGRERERERQRHRQREKQAPSREPVSRITAWAEDGAKPLSDPGSTSSLVFSNFRIICSSSVKNIIAMLMRIALNV